MEQGPAHTPEHNSVAERYNRTIMERCRAQMIHASLPKHPWGEITLATSHILNMSPTRSADEIPADAWQQACAGKGSHLSDHKFLRVLGCQALTHIPKSLRQILDPCARELIHVGYDPGSKAYRLWDAQTNRVLISRDVNFNKLYFPMRNHTSHQLSADENDIEEELTLGATHDHQQREDNDDVNTQPYNLPNPSLPPTPAPEPSRPTRTARAPSRYGNTISYAAVTRGGHDADNPTYAQAMAGPDAAHWRAAMKVEFYSLVLHSVGRLIKRPSKANVLGGMWCFKRKRETSGAITKYKARWVILGNYQIHGLDYFETYASVGVKESFMALYSLAASEDLVESFDIITAFLTGSMDVPVHSVQVKGFKDESRDVLLLDQSIYGAKQAHRQFNATLKSKLASIGFHSREVDDSLYSKWDGASFVHIHMHVDDGLVVSNSKSMVQRRVKISLLCMMSSGIQIQPSTSESKSSEIGPGE